MAHSHAEITASVGRDGANRPHDVRIIQQLINDHRPPEIQRLAVDGVPGPLTIAAIVACQTTIVHLSHPDGRVDPQGRTLGALNRLEAPTHPVQHPKHPASHAAAAAPTKPAAPAAATSPAKPATPAGPATPASAATTAAIPGYPSEVISAAQAAQTANHIPASVTMAQWALESGHGAHMPSGSNNPFGIKAAGSQPFVEARTREVVHGRSIYIMAHFRKFDTLADAFIKHGELLANAKPYANARAQLPDADKFADALTGVYATDPNYGALLKQIMKGANLYRYN
ncbi:glycoside hydrolase family 73 protein [Glacieibacterium megasporae]|uniref:glycoside hydrolase family 73 protein n=1 Tax=Glacieibacterium megasporae TaxID=2835787 RepID=UPI001C1DD3E5|nr:glucosaminidase domain-containing protein [Polymorphobacter megasporae]UAJ10181.1 glucosaminidase domain-containing protein [Polymorphobacter megasporae]